MSFAKELVDNLSSTIIGHAQDRGGKDLFKIKLKVEVIETGGDKTVIEKSFDEYHWGSGRR